jgi:N-glycosidase YbiA
MEPFLFFGRDNPGGWASNFYPCTFEMHAITFNCGEQAFMWGKSEDPLYRERLLSLLNPVEMKRLGRSCVLRSGWDDVKKEWMTQVQRAKYSQNPHFLAKLKKTGTASIHESCNDPWWGGGPHYPEGRDWLGQILMQIREELS